jgi:membrane-bound lytic murein transglycosylase A
MLSGLQRHNEYFVFFKPTEQGPLGCINVPLTRGRSLSLDTRLFPKGALAYMSSKKPLVNDEGTVAGSTEFSRFVINQDTGLRIKGADRANLFWGNGPEAESLAWHFNHDGELYILIKNPY